MRLSEEDSKLFYKLWLPLLDYVNKKYGVNENLPEMASAGGLNPVEVKEVANKLWDDVSVIDEYLSEQTDGMPEEHRMIIKGWKRKVQGRFILERHLKKGSIFIFTEDNSVYLVSGIVSSWQEMFPYAHLPMMLDATLIPFKDVIISDGLVVPYRIVIGGNMARSFKEIYMENKSNGLVHKTL